ncbi:MAG: hypothetical protein IK061_08130, partial [Desulfovibrio sp.]|nr:hypothetical protein [Desulfovibrio sp.]
MKTKLKTTKQRVDGLLAVYPVCTADQKERFYQAMVEEYEFGFDDGQKQTHEEGYKQGHSEGFDKGRSYGLEEGRKEAQQEAYSKGKADGRRSGFSEGRLKGFKEGLKEGHKAGSDEVRAERLGVSLIESLMQGPGKPGRDEVAAKIRKDLAPFATPCIPDSQTDQTGQSSQLEQANQTDLPVQTDQPGLTDQTGQLDLAGQADKMDLPSLVAKRFAQDAAWNCGPARAQGPYGPRREGAMAGEAPLAGSGSQTGDALRESP